MTWEALTIIEVEGQPPDVAFSQWVDLSAAAAWLAEAKRRTDPSVIANLQTANWSQQYAAVVNAWNALGLFYKSLNLRWYCDPVIWDLYRSWHGGYDRVDPPRECIEKPTGPSAVYGRPATKYYDCVLERPPVGNTVDARERDAATIPQVCTARGPTDFIVDTRLRAIWQALKPGGRTDFYHVVPAFLNYLSAPVVVDTRNPASGPDVIHMDGLFTGAACATPTGVLVEVPRDTTAWTWDCLRWDDAPFNAPRLMPPLKWSLEEAAAWVRVLSARGARATVFDTRVTTILENLLRAKEAGVLADDLATADLAEFERIRGQRHDPSKTRQIFESAGGLACTAAAAAGGIGGLICGVAVAGIEAIASILPLAVGCTYDQFSLPTPAVLNPRISQTSPPSFQIPAPPASQLPPGSEVLVLDPHLKVFSLNETAIRLKPPAVPVQLFKTTEPGTGLGNVAGTGTGNTPPVTEQGSGSGAGAAAVGIGLLLLLKALA